MDDETLRRLALYFFGFMTAMGLVLFTHAAVRIRELKRLRRDLEARFRPRL